MWSVPSSYSSINLYGTVVNIKNVKLEILTWKILTGFFESKIQKDSWMVGLVARRMAMILFVAYYSSLLL